MHQMQVNATRVLTVDDIHRAVDMLSKANTPVGGDGYYYAHLSPKNYFMVEIARLQGLAETALRQNAGKNRSKLRRVLRTRFQFNGDTVQFLRWLLRTSGILGV